MNNSNYESFIDQFVADFTKDFSDFFDSTTNCTQNISLSNKINLNVSNATISGCDINITQANDLTKGERLCSELSQRLFELSPEELGVMINDRLKAVTDRYNLPSSFKNMLRDKLVDFFMNNRISDVANCSQNIVVDKDQVIYINGEFKCINGSSLTINNKSIVNGFLKCLINPIMMVLKTDLFLKRAFESPSRDCVWDKIPEEGCKNGKRKYVIKVLKDKYGEGICNARDGDIIFESCDVPECRMGRWSEWSPCINGRQSRIRNIESPGVNCPSTIDTTNCTQPPPFREIPKSDNFLITGGYPPVLWTILVVIPFVALLIMIYKKGR